MRDGRRIILRLVIASVAGVLAIGRLGRGDTSSAVVMLAIVTWQVVRLFAPASFGKGSSVVMPLMMWSASIFFVAGALLMLFKGFQQMSSTDGSLFLFACYVAVSVMNAALAYIFVVSGRGHWRLRAAS